MYFLIITFGFLLAMRGGRHAPLQRPLEGLRHIVREGADLFFTTSDKALASITKPAKMIKYSPILRETVTDHWIKKYKPKHK